MVREGLVPAACHKQQLRRHVPSQNDREGSFEESFSALTLVSSEAEFSHSCRNSTLKLQLVSAPPTSSFFKAAPCNFVYVPLPARWGGMRACLRSQTAPCPGKFECVPHPGSLSLSLPLNNLPLLRKVLGILFGFCFWLRDSKQRRHLLLLTSRSLYKE